MLEERSPTEGPTPSPDVPEQDPPGVEAQMKPKADHGEKSYKGAEKLEGLVALIPSTFPHDHVKEFGKDTLWERPAQPAEIAPSYVFLASADARFYSGEVLSPTGKTTSR